MSTPITFLRRETIHNGTASPLEIEHFSNGSRIERHPGQGARYFAPDGSEVLATCSITHAMRTASRVRP